MAAVTGHIEDGDILDEGEGTLNGLGAAKHNVRASPRDLPNMHRSLTGTHWVRSALAWYLQKVKVRHEWDGDELLIRIVDAPARDKKGPYVPQNTVPWQRMAAPLREIRVWGEANSKMNCPSFDLPTGAPTVGGTCPGALEGQSIVPNRKGVLPTGEKVNLHTAICMSCYAEVSNYRYTDNQLRMLIRQIWVQGMLKADPKGFVEAMVESLLGINESAFGRKGIGRPPGNILPVRIHSAGDFFSQKYASAWLDIANEIAKRGERGARFRFWAPTRTWAAPGWVNFWQTNLPRLQQQNFLVRPSAFHFDDPAPGPFVPGSGAGSTSLHMQDAASELNRKDFHAQGTERAKFDWRCPTYSAQEGTMKSCSMSPHPSGDKTTHCRACWTMPNMRIDYPAH